eukprot:m51a1_g10877 putative sh3 domain-binding protein 1-like (317) ;mRNA; r:20072-23353
MCGAQPLVPARAAARGAVRGDSEPPSTRSAEQTIPVVVQCARFLLERGGLVCEGIFRVSGSASRTEELQASLDKRQAIDADKYGPHEVAQVLKRFLASLPEPLFTHDGWQRLVTGSAVRKSVRDVVEQLPAIHRRLATYLFHDFFPAVVQHSAVNKMTATNLAIVIAPSVLKPRPEATDTLLLRKQEHLFLIHKASEVVRLMLDDHEAPLSQTVVDPCSVSGPGGVPAAVFAPLLFEPVGERMRGRVAAGVRARNRSNSCGQSREPEPEVQHLALGPAAEESRAVRVLTAKRDERAHQRTLLDTSMHIRGPPGDLP